MRILLTGFGPFLDIVDNPSQRIVEAIATDHPSEAQITPIVLPVSYSRAWKLICAELSERPYDAAILLGVAGGSSSIRLERMARAGNYADALDEDGENLFHLDATEEIAGHFSTSLNLANLQQQLADGSFHVDLSDDAGGYVCNHTYYEVLRVINENRWQADCLFVHVPPHETARIQNTGPSMPITQSIATVRAILSALVNLRTNR